MKLTRCVILLLALALLALPLAACAEETPPAPTTVPTEDAAVDTSPEEIPDAPDAQAALAVLEIPVSSAAEFTAVPEGEGVCVTGYTGEGTSVSVPAVLDGKSVVAIGDGAFADAPITVLVLPESVTRIGSGILAGCTALTALRTPLLGETAGKAQYLGYLFGGTRFEDNPRDVPVSLHTLALCGAWEALPAFSLYDCNDLTLVSLPDTVRTLERFSLSRCASLTAVDGLSSVRVLGEHALSYCESLETLTLGASVTEIGASALEGCAALRHLSVPFVGGGGEENAYLGYVFGAAYPDFSRTYYPARLSRVEVTGGRALGANAFFECTSLREILLPEGLETVGARAFFGCTSLWRVTLPDTVRSIGAASFAGCDALLSVDLGTSLSAMGINAFLNCDSLTALTLPDTLAALPASALAGCASLAEVDLGGVRTVGAQAFRGCAALQTVRTEHSVSLGEGNEALGRLLGA